MNETVWSLHTPFILTHISDIRIPFFLVSINPNTLNYDLSSYHLIHWREFVELWCFLSLCHKCVYALMCGVAISHNLLSNIQILTKKFQINPLFLFILCSYMYFYKLNYVLECNNSMSEPGKKIDLMDFKPI